MLHIFRLDYLKLWKAIVLVVEMNNARTTRQNRITRIDINQHS
jgi:hypothetical protein